MKNMKKFLALALALVMILAMATTASADPVYSITVENGKAAEIYKAFKMLDLSVNDPKNPTAFRYTVNTAWAEFKENVAFQNAFNVDAQGYVTAKDEATSEADWNANSVMSKLAEAAAKYAKDKNLVAAASVTAGADGNVVLSLEDPGYYVVTSTLGSRAMIKTTPSETSVTIKEKNEGNTVEKLVQEDSTGNYVEENDAQIGDTVNFKSEVTVAARSVNVKIHDTMDEGLTFTAGSIKIYTDAELETELAAEYYEIQATADEGDTFTIKIKDTFAATATGAQKLYVTYSAVLNEKAVANMTIVKQDNDTYVSYGAGSETVVSSTSTDTHKFSVFKHAKDATDNLAGAVFEVKKDGVALKLVKIDDNNYRIADADDTATVDTFITVADGDIVIWGVDADTDYTLKETAAPAGYNLLPNEIEVTVDAANSTRVDVVNQTGAELPFTGGMGTTLFYIVGGALALAAVVLLVTKKRMASAE